MRNFRFFLVLVMLLLLMGGLALFLGMIPLSPFKFLTGFSATEKEIFFSLRLPRVLLAGGVGALLSLSGLILQSTLKNPLADPYILGTSSGAAIGAAIAINFNLYFTLLGISSVPLLAFSFALLAVFVVYTLSAVGREVLPVRLILSGVAISAFLAAILSLIIILSGELTAIYFWLLGSFSGASMSDFLTILPYLLIGFLITFFYGRELDAFLLGDEVAESLGVNVSFLRKMMLLLASLMTAAAVSFCGMIGFLGLMVPHMMRLIVGARHRLLIPLTTLAGMILMIFADLLARIIMAPLEMPVGVLMALLGTPFFIYLLRRKSNGI